MKNVQRKPGPLFSLQDPRLDDPSQVDGLLDGFGDDPHSPDEDTLRATYAAFNARDIEAVLERMHPEVDWPNAWEGGRVTGHQAVRDYWTRQFDQISAKVEPERFDWEPDGSITVTVHQLVHDTKTGELQADTHVLHRYRLEDGLIIRMDVLDAPA